MRSLISVLLVIFVSGCALPTDYAASNRFSGIVPKPVNKPYAGLWSGANGSHVMTLRIDKDGRGVACSSTSGTDSTSSLKLSDDALYFEDGTEMALTYTDGYINGVSLNPGSQSIRFAQDNGLIEATPYCRERLQKPYL